MNQYAILVQFKQQAELLEWLGCSFRVADRTYDARRVGVRSAARDMMELVRR
jgi:hypothetical protein